VARKAGKESEQRAAGAAVVKLGASLTLGNAGEIKETLAAAVAGGGKITLDAGAVEEIDLAGLQLICAAHRAATHDGRELEIAGRCAALTDAIGALGFGRDVGCGERCLCREVARG
jgi:anti-anti-sigma regulatory factor